VTLLNPSRAKDATRGGVWRGLCGIFDGSLCMLVSSVCRGRQHASSSAGGHWRSAFGAFRPGRK
jgi:hypothetical protein